MRCGIEKPIAFFRLRRRGHSERCDECARCHSEQENARRKRKRQKWSDRKTAGIVRQIAQLSDENDRVRVLANRLLTQFGGPRRVAILLGDILRRKPDSQVSGNILLATMRLRFYAETHPVEPLDEDKQRQAYREICMFNLERPHVAANCLREIGWRVEPPPIPAQDVTRADCLLPPESAK